jgi:predicted membrane protein
MVTRDHRHLLAVLILVKRLLRKYLMLILFEFWQICFGIVLCYILLHVDVHSRLIDTKVYNLHSYFQFNI